MDKAKARLTKAVGVKSKGMTSASVQETESSLSAQRWRAQQTIAWPDIPPTSVHPPNMEASLKRQGDLPP